jgi:hypothetical protein
LESQHDKQEVPVRAWEAISGAGDLSVSEGALAPEAKWRGVELKGCADRAAATTYAQTGTTGAG